MKPSTKTTSENIQTEVEQIKTAIEGEQARLKLIHADKEKLEQDKAINDDAMGQLRRSYRSDENDEVTLESLEREAVELNIKQNRLDKESDETKARLDMLNADLATAQRVADATEFEKLGNQATALLESAEVKITAACEDLVKFKSIRREIETVGRKLEISDSEMTMLTRRQLTKDYIDATLNEFTEHVNPPAYARVPMSLRFKELIEKIIHRLRTGNQANRNKAA